VEYDFKNRYILNNIVYDLYRGFLEKKKQLLKKYVFNRHPLRLNLTKIRPGKKKFIILSKKE